MVHEYTSSVLVFEDIGSRLLPRSNYMDSNIYESNTCGDCKRNDRAKRCVEFGVVKS